MCVQESLLPEDKAKKIPASKDKRPSLSLLPPPMAAQLRHERLYWERVLKDHTSFAAVSGKDTWKGLK